jgi:RepB DNA-primase from phage plasmid/Family of unknown function (DUF5906)/D5 N terminal like
MDTTNPPGQDEPTAGDILAALQFRYDTAPGNNKFTVHYSETDEDFRWLGVYRVSELEAAARDISGKRHCHIWSRMTVLPEGFNATATNRGLATDTAYATCLWVDLDPPHQTMDAEWKRQKLAQLEAFTPTPSRIEDSGRGLYALWRLEHPTDDIVRVEEANKWLTQVLGGDNAGDAARVLRVPGTLNRKQGIDQWARVLTENNDQHSLGTFDRIPLTPVEGATRATRLLAAPIPLDFQRQIEVMQDGEELWDRIRSEESAMEQGAVRRSDGRVQRFRNDARISLCLLRAGADDELVFAVLTHPVWFSGDKWRTEGRHDSYPIRTIEYAKELLRESPTSARDGARFHNALARKLESLTRLLMIYRDEWYRWDNDAGLYRPHADNWIALRLQDIVGETWKSTSLDEVLRILKPRAIERGESFPERDVDLGDWIPCENGMLNWRTGEMRDPRPSDPVFWRLPALWDSLADASEVDEYIDSLMDEQNARLWWMFSGYCLITSTRYRCILALKGDAMTGKSTLLKALTMFVGDQNVSTVSLHDLTSYQDFGIAPLLDARLNVDFDCPVGQMMHVNLLKKLSTGDMVNVNRKYKEALRAVRLSVKLAFVMNDYPEFPEADKAFHTRWRTIEIRDGREPFVGKSDVPMYHLHLLQFPRNRSAWLKRSVEGLRWLHDLDGKRGMEGFPPDRYAEHQMKQSNPLFRFYLETTLSDLDLTWKPMHELHRAYLIWWGDANLDHKHRLGLQRFGPQSKELAKRWANDVYSIDGLEVRHTSERWEYRGRRLIGQRTENETG